MVPSSDTRMSASNRSMSSERAAAGEAKASAAVKVSAVSQETRRMGSGGGRREADLRCLALLAACELEELAGLETEGARDDALGELRDLRVQVAHHGVVVPPRVSDRVLDLAQRPLQRGEALDGAQLRIGLGQREQALERAGERALRLRLRAWPLGGHGAVARADHGLQRGALVPGVALHRLDEVRNQVVAAFELNVDVRPRVLGLNLEANEAVVDRDHHQDDQRERSADYPPDGHGGDSTAPPDGGPRNSPSASLGSERDLVDDRRVRLEGPEDVQRRPVDAVVATEAVARDELQHVVGRGVRAGGVREDRPRPVDRARAIGRPAAGWDPGQIMDELGATYSLVAARRNRRPDRSNGRGIGREGEVGAKRNRAGLDVGNRVDTQLRTGLRQPDHELLSRDGGHGTGVGDLPGSDDIATTGLRERALLRVAAAAAAGRERQRGNDADAPNPHAAQDRPGNPAVSKRTA